MWFVIDKLVLSSQCLIHSCFLIYPKLGERSERVLVCLSPANTTREVFSHFEITTQNPVRSIHFWQLHIYSWTYELWVELCGLNNGRLAILNVISFVRLLSSYGVIECLCRGTRCELLQNL